MSHRAAMSRIKSESPFKVYRLLRQLGFWWRSVRTLRAQSVFKENKNTDKLRCFQLTFCNSTTHVGVCHEKHGENKTIKHSLTRFNRHERRSHGISHCRKQIGRLRRCPCNHERLFNNLRFITAGCFPLTVRTLVASQSPFRPL